MKNKILNKNAEMKVTYTYVEPKDDAEAEEYKRRIDKAYEILFEEVLKNREEKKKKETPSRTLIG